MHGEWDQLKEPVDDERLRFFGPLDRWHRSAPGPVPGPSAADRQCGEQMRLHPAVRGVGGALPEISRARPGGAGVSLRSVRASRAGHRGGNQEILLAELWRELPDVRQGEGQWTGYQPSVRVSE